MWPLFYGMIAIISANTIFCQRKHGRKYFREYPYNGEDDLEALFLSTRPCLFLDLKFC
jgi:hypothetical protein